MGCDIHFYVEKRDKNGVWHCIPKNFYSERHYPLFALLANVRNDFGRVKPIAYPRGLPECISATVARDADIWKLDGHSYSYYTLTEIINFDWNNNQLLIEQCMPLQKYANWDKISDPEEDVGYWWDTENKIISMTEADRLIESGLNLAAEIMEESYKVKITWYKPYVNFFSSFLDAINRILKLDKDPNNLRIVFWFDN